MKSRSKVDKPTAPEGLAKQEKGLLADSIILGIPQIFRSRGWRRRAKTFILAMCSLGFLYQVLNFSLLFLAFPTTLNVEIEQPDDLLSPAFTACSRSFVKKSSFCSQNAKKCQILSDGELYVDPSHDAEFFAGTSQKQLINFSIPWKEIVHYQQLGWNGESYLDGENVREFRFISSRGERIPCLVMNHLLDGPKKNISIPNKSWDMQFFLRTVVLLGSYLNVSEYFREKDDLLTITLHSPFELADPYLDGFPSRDHHVLMLKFSLTEIHLLEYPYPTDCYNYIGNRARTGTGPISKQMCREECIYRKSMEACSCTPPNVLYPNTARFCEKDDSSCLEHVDVEECHENCKRDCVIYQYNNEYTHREISQAFPLVQNYLDTFMVKEPEFDVDYLTEPAKSFKKIGIFSKTTEKRIYRYKPKYELIELFSYIGGYIGIWLGLSIPAMADIFKMAAIHGARQKKKSSPPSPDGP